VPVYLLIPLGSAFFYALGSILVKRGLKEGANLGQTFHLSNLVLGLVFLPLFFFETKEINWADWWKPLVLTLVFLAATWLTFLSLKRGDVSLVTPLMGTKVVFVALGMTFLTGKSPGHALWLAAVMTAVGIFVMGIGDMKKGKHVVFTILVTLCSATGFGLYDVILSTWGVEFGAMAFLSVSCVGVSFGTIVIWLFQGRPGLKVKSGTAKSVWAGVTIIALQSVALGLALGYFNDATGINVMYASRGLWVIVIVMFLGRHLGNHEHKQPDRTFLWRVVGTLILTTAIIMAVIDRAKVG